MQLWRVRQRTTLPLTLVLIGAGCDRGAPEQADAPAPAAVAEPTSAGAVLRNAAGDSVGWARLTQATAGSVDVEVEVGTTSPGDHGVHFHAVGTCDGGGESPFGSAGGHHNPAGRKHGLENPEGPHNGDLPNLTTDSTGRGMLRASTDRVTLAAGTASLFDADGSALVVHAGADDQKTDPSGNSGSRVACGVIRS